MIGELHTFVRSVRSDVDDLLGLFDRIATTTGEEREEHIDTLAEMGRNGELLAPDDS